MNELFKRNFEAVKAQGKITNKTTIREFELKLHEELWEVASARFMDKKADELGDLILTACSYLIAYGYDVENVLESMVEKNERRAQPINKL